LAPLPALKTLMATMISAVSLPVALTVVEGRALLEFHKVCLEVPRIISAQKKATHMQLNSSLARRHWFLQEKNRLT